MGNPEPTFARRWLYIALALASATMFALSAQALPWWTYPDVAVGPRASKACFQGECTTQALAWLGGGDRWVTLGTAAYVSALLSAVLSVYLAGAWAAGRRPRIGANMAVVAYTLTLGLGAVFAFTAPTLPGAMLGPGIPVVFAACALGVVATVVVQKRRGQG